LISFASYKFKPLVPAFFEDSDPARSIIVKNETFSDDFDLLSSSTTDYVIFIVTITWLLEDSRFKSVDAIALYFLASNIIFSNCSIVSNGISFASFIGLGF